jgi:hypothetical protein
MDPAGAEADIKKSRGDDDVSKLSGPKWLFQQYNCVLRIFISFQSPVDILTCY